MRFAKPFALLLLLLLSSQFIIAQDISPTFFGQNAWMPHQFGDGTYHNNPQPSTVYGKLDQLWGKVENSRVNVIRVGGINPDANKPTNSQYVGLIDSIRSIGAEPILQVSYWNGRYDTSQAAALVRYLNDTLSKNIRYWSIGNEPVLKYGVSSSAIAAYFKSFAHAMKNADSDIIIVGPDLAWYNYAIVNDLLGGSEDITGTDGNGNYYLDIFAFHTYPYSGTQSRADVVGYPTGSFTTQVNHLVGKINTVNTMHSRTGNDALRWAVTEFHVNYNNPATNDVDGTGCHGFLAGQFWAEMYARCLLDEAVFVLPWSVHESAGNRSTYDLGYLDNNTTFVPRSTYYHHQLMSNYFSGSFTMGTSTNSLVKAFSSKDCNRVAIMVMNQNTTEEYYSLRLDNSAHSSGFANQISVNLMISTEINDTIDNESTHVLIFDTSGLYIDKITYSKDQHASLELPPSSIEMETVGYTESTDNILNPERGMYKQFTAYSNNSFGWAPIMEPLSPTELTDMRNIDEANLALRLYYLTEFSGSVISDEFLNFIEQDFAIAREAGVKLILRFAYSKTASHQHSDDAAVSWVLAHIGQLEPLLQRNSDIIATVQAGFVGAWGEWYYAHPDFYNAGSFSYTNRIVVLDSLLRAIPKDRAVQIRTPFYKQDIFGTGTGASNALQLAQAFNESDLARVGHHNDCFLASATDFGTYTDQSTQYPYLSQDTKFLPMGGETCNLFQPRSDCSSITGGMADIELDSFHWDYLNLEYNTLVNNNWNAQNATPSTYGSCYDDIKRKLGYRFLVNQSALPKTIQQGELLPVHLDIINKGYSSPFNARRFELVLENSVDTSVRYKHIYNHDVRYWFKESEVGTIELRDTLQLDHHIPCGTYNVYLHFPDLDHRLYGNPDFSVQLANNLTWQSFSGYNKLNHQLVITPGSNNSNEEIDIISTDLGIHQLTQPNLPLCGSSAISPEVVVKNYGQDTIYSFNTSFFVNQNLEAQSSWSGSLAPGATTTISFSSYVFTSGDYFEIELSQINNRPYDIRRDNDVVGGLIRFALSGDYDIGPSGDYTSFSEAKSALESNGVCGPVVFAVAAGAYNEQVSIGSIDGASSVNTITFTGGIGNAPVCTLTYAATSSGSKHTLRFLGAHHCTFEHMTIEATGASYGWPVHIMDSTSKHIQVSNCIIKTDSTSTSSNHIAVVINGDVYNFNVGENANHNRILNNTIVGGSIGISVFGKAWNSLSSGNHLVGNHLFGFTEYGIRLANQTSFEARFNSIIGNGVHSSSQGIYGVDVHSGTSPNKFIGNIIHSIGLYGIRLNHAYGSLSDYALIQNNMIGGGFVNTTPRGIYLIDCDYWNISHNSISLDQDNGSSTSICPIYVTSGNYFDVFNNNLSHASATGSGMAIRLPAASNLSIDHNNYHNAAGSNLVRIGGTIYNNTNYTTGAGSNSINTAPDFLNATDLHLDCASSKIDQGAILSPAIVVDIDSNARPVNGQPDIGADEVGIANQIYGLQHSSAGITKTFQSTGSGTWEELTRDCQPILAINDNGQTLGAVTVTLNIHDGSIREANDQFMIDRNFEITTEVAPSSPVGIRIYFKQSEFDDLKLLDPNTNHLSDLSITKYNGPTEDLHLNFDDATSLSNLTVSDTQSIYDGYYLEGSTSSFSEFWLNGPTSTPLVLENLVFAGTAKEKHNLLEWHLFTNQLEQVQSIGLKKSSDATSWTLLEETKVDGTEDLKGVYNDYRIEEPSNYYILEIQHSNNRTILSDIVVVNRSITTSELQIWPNPVVNGTLQLRSLGSDFYQVQIFNLSNKLIFEESLVSSEEVHTIDLSELSSGSYWLKVKGENGDETQLLIISH